jgi:SAM-dependent methyltransferase
VNDGARRRNPPWWDHQRHPLVALRRCVEALLREQVSAGRGERVYDIGCGDRPYEPLVRARGYEYIGCDLDGSPDVLLAPGQPIAVADGAAAGVVSFQVLEHVWDLDWYLGECRRLLTPAGWLLLSTHGVWPYHPHPADHRRWTRTGLRGELESRGFDVVDFRALLGPLAWTTQIRALGYRHVLQAIPGLRVLSPILALGMNLRMAVEDAITPAAIRDDNASIYVAFCRRRAGVEVRR